MPWGLRRYQQCGHLHFITFSCYRRRQRLDPRTRRMFERALERARAKYGFRVFGYVVMPEHVHLLVSEPEGVSLATAIKAMKQSVARREGGRFWQERYYDFNVWSERKRVEKLRYIHRNPVRRGLVESPEQ
jgi:putative transposase